MFSKKIIIDSNASLRWTNENQVGGKAYNLYRLRQYSVNVPNWFVVTTKVFNENIDRIKIVIHDKINTIDFNNYKSIESASSKIVKFINCLHFPELNPLLLFFE